MVRLRPLSLAATALLATACSSEPPTLLRADDEPSGPRCPTGGLTLSSGRDEDGSGVLELSEVESTRLVCNGSGTRVLTVLEPSDAQSCPAGGFVARSGLDDNGNGSLEEDEVDATTTACDRLPERIVGSVTVRNDRDLSLLSSCREVTGDLLIDLADVDSLQALQALETVGGSLTLEHARKLTVAALPLLANVTGALRVAGAEALTTLSLSALTSAGSITVESTPVLTSLSLPLLSRVEGDLSLSGASALTSLSLPALATTTGTIRLAGLPALGPVELPSLTAAGGLAIADSGAVRPDPTTPATVTLAATQLAQITGSLEVTRVNGLDLLSLPALASVGGSVIVGEMGAPSGLETPSDAPRPLPRIDLPLLATITGDLQLTTIPALDDASDGQQISRGVHLPLLATIGGRLQASALGAGGVTKALTLVLPALTAARTLELTDGFVRGLQLPALTTLESLVLRSNPELRMLVAPVLAAPAVLDIAFNDQLPQGTWCIAAAPVQQALALTTPLSADLTAAGGGPTETATALGCGPLFAQ